MLLVHFIYIHPLELNYDFEFRNFQTFFTVMSFLDQTKTPPTRVDMLTPMNITTL